MGLGLVGIIGLVALAIIALPLLAGAVLVILIVSNRADPDPTGKRPAVVYGFAVSFITLFVTLFSTFVIVSELWSLIGSHHVAVASGDSQDLNDLFGSSGSVSGPVAKHPYGDSVARSVVIALLLVIVAGYVYRKHVRAAERATAGVAFADPSGRVRSSYVAAVSFVCTVIATISTVVATYQIFRLIAPGVFNSGGSGSRVGALRVLLPLIYLAAASVYLLRRHVTQLPPDSRPFFGLMPGVGSGPAAADSSAPAPEEVELVEVEMLDVAPPPRKRAAKKTAPPPK